jgi:predicted peptidase
MFHDAVMLDMVQIAGIRDRRHNPWSRRYSAGMISTGYLYDMITPKADAGKKCPLLLCLHGAGGTPKYTEYPGVKHNSWGPAYADPELMTWLFAQKRGGKPAAAK